MISPNEFLHWGDKGVNMAKNKPDEQEKAPDHSGDDVAHTEEKLSVTAGNVVTGIVVQLRSIHPQDSYGRAGFRFSKTEKIEIQLSQLDALALAELQDDPWLDIEWVAE